MHQPAAGIFPGIGSKLTPTTQGDGTWGRNKITGMTIQYAQKDKLPQHLPENRWVESTGTGGNGGTVGGRAYWNLDVLQGALNHNTVNAFGGKDIPAAGLKVVGSYLTDEAVNKIEEYAKDNFGAKTLRGGDWTPADEAGLQKWINEQIAAAPEEWIAETLTTTTAADGEFELRFKGIWGSSRTYRGIVPQDKFGKLADSHGEGVWTRGARNSKHLNLHWSYVSIYDKDGNPLPDSIGALYPWSLGQWAGPGFGAGLNAGGGAQYFGGDGTFIGETTAAYTGLGIALAPQALKFDVVDKNTTDNWANIGDKVQTDTAGLLISEDLNYYIEWVDKAGTVVKTCDTAKADAATKIPSCALDVPADAQTGDTFTARLKVADGDPDPKNDLVLALDAFAVTREYLAYEEVEAKESEEATSEPKFDNPATEDVETKPEKASFELGKLPAGVSADQVKVDPVTGFVTFTPNTDQVLKKFRFPVIMRDEDLQVPVLDENGDSVKDDEGNPVTQARVVARGEAAFKVAEKTDAETYDPKGQDQTVKTGETPDPKKNIENAGDLPEDTKFEYKETPDTKTPGEKNVTVVVSYPDGTTVGVETTITVTEIPDTTAPTVDPIKPSASVITGKGDRPGEDIKVMLPNGTVIETTTDENGNWSVAVPEHIDLNESDKITVADGAGNATLATVEPREAAQKQQDEYEPTYATTWGHAGQNATSVKPLFTRTLSGHNFERQPAPEGVMYALGEDAPDSASIGSDGRVTVLLPDDKAKIDPIPVVVTYADQTTDIAYAEFKFRQRPQSETVDVEYQQGVMAAPGETVDVNNLAQGEMPEGAEFTLAPNQDFKGWFITVDEETGVVSATAPEDGGADTLKIKVKVTYADGSEDNVEVGVRKKPDPATSQFQPKYEDAVVTKQTAHEALQLKGLPEGTTFSVANDGGLDVDVNKRTGKLDVKARPNSTPDATHQVTVRVQYPDGTSELVTVAFTVDSQARNNTTTWETMRVPVKGIADEANKNPAPQNTKFAIAKDFAKPGWAVEVNPTTGKLTVAADKTVNVGETVEIPVVMTLPDASQRMVLIKAVAAAEQNTCDATSSVGLSSDACVEGSSTSVFGIISIILGVLALVGGGAAALFINQDTVRDILRQNGINI